MQTTNSNQTARIRRLVWVFVGRKCQKVRFLSLRSRSLIWFKGYWYFLRSDNSIKIALPPFWYLLYSKRKEFAPPCEQIISFSSRPLGFKCLTIALFCTLKRSDIRAATCGNVPTDKCAQYRLKSAWASGHLLGVFADRMKKLCILGYRECAHWRFWSDSANVQAGLNLSRAHIFEGTFSDVAFQLV